MAEIRTRAQLLKELTELRQRVSRLETQGGHLRRAQEALRTSEERHRTYVEAAPESIFVWDTNGIQVDANPAACRLSGYAKEELIGRHIRELVAPESAADARSVFDQVKRAGRGRAELKARRKDGTTVQVLATAVALPDGRYLSFATDISERMLLEAELRRVRNLESLGHLAGGIAHDFNNTLTVVTGNLALLGRRLGDDRMACESLADAQRAAEKVKDLAQQLMTFSAGGAPGKRAASIEDLIRESTELALHGSKTKPEFVFADGLRAVDVDHAQISQVVQNLVLNADQAMADGGVLRISAENVAIQKSDPLPLAPGEYVRVVFADEGVGISETAQRHIFDPFYGTREAGHGLGLSICYSILRRHGGHITVRSEVDRGSEFTFYVPASTLPVSVASRNGRTTVKAGRILVMDDDEGVRRIVERMLEKLGHEVECVRDGALALAAYVEAMAGNRPFDAVIMDLTVSGGMGGKEAVAKLHEVHPEARVIVASGYSHDPVMSDPEPHGFVASVRKPIDMDELERAVCRAMERE